MQTWDVELRGTITRDVRYMECDAESECDVRKACAEEYPTYRVHAITPRLSSGGSPTAGAATPAAGTKAE